MKLGLQRYLLICSTNSYTCARLSRELGCGDGFDKGRSPRSPWAAPFASTEDGAWPLGTAHGCGDESRQHPIPACPPSLHSWGSDCKSSSARAKEPGSPAIWSSAHCPSPESHSLPHGSPPPGQQASPAQAPPGREARAPPTAFWPHLLRTPYLRFSSQLPDPVQSLPPH